MRWRCGVYVIAALEPLMVHFSCLSRSCGDEALVPMIALHFLGLPWTWLSSPYVLPASLARYGDFSEVVGVGLNLVGLYLIGFVLDQRRRREGPENSAA